MHISESRESPNTILTKCAKMNEDSHKRLGINGNSDGTVVKGKEDNPKNVYTPPTPGGRLKFFKDGKFILELERAKEGERVSWVSVPRKTFWPPQGVATSVICKQESSTSLSVSDDNSSVHSSPWQRDHCWKQTSPRRNLSKAMCFYYWRPKKARRLPLRNRMKVGADQKPDVVDGCNRVPRRTCAKRRPLLAIIQHLMERRASSPPKPETIVSPRKRFLRDMDKDKATSDDCVQKRIKNKGQTGVGVSVTNGHSEEKPVTSKNCSYSITSLLAEDRVPAKRSPNNSPSHFVPVTATAAAVATSAPVQKNYNTAKSEDVWFSESVERFRSIELSHAEKSPFHSYPHHTYMPPFVYPYSYPNCYSYNRGFPPIPPPLYHHSPNLAVPIVRQEVASCSWKNDRTEQSDRHKEDANVSDMPLNLSKHAG